MPIGAVTGSDGEYRFANACLCASRRELLVDDVPVALGARSFDLLQLLIEQRERVVPKDELLHTVWAGRVVEDNSLQASVSALRKLLGAQAIATVPGRGYRFVLPVDPRGAAVPIGAAPPSVPAERLFGRDDDLQRLAALLQTAPVVTLVGPGGIGKTSLARALVRQVQSRYADGVVWVDLAPMAESEGVAASVLRALGLSGTDAPQPAQAFATRHTLLVLDNAEHLIDAVAAFVVGLSAATRLCVMLTSQEPAHVPGEQLFRVGPLDVSAAGEPPDPSAGALALLIARARALAPNLPIEADAAALAAAAEICRRLDGIPLAIELAAARLPLLGVEGVRLHLDERLRLLTAGHRTGLRRHQTLRAAFDWSHQLLSQPEQALFARLAVFVGGFTLEAAQQVGADDAVDSWAVVEHLGGLVDKSMVLVAGAGPVPRYALLETARAYALEKLAERGETDSTLLRHAQALVSMLRVYEQDDRRWRCSEADNRAAAAEVDNVRAALAWLAGRDDLHRIGAELAALSFRAWFYAGLAVEGVRRCLVWWEPAQRLAPPQTVGLLGYTLARMGYREADLRMLQAIDCATQRYRTLGDRARLYDALNYASHIACGRGDVVTAERWLAEARELEDPAWPPRARAVRCNSEASLLMSVGDHAAALRWYDAQRACYEGHALGVDIASSNRALAEAMLGNDAAVIEAMTTMRARHLQARSPGAAYSLNWLLPLVVALVHRERIDEAINHLREASALALQQGSALPVLGLTTDCLLARGRWHDAARTAGCADAAVRERGLVSWAYWRQRRATTQHQLELALGPVVLARCLAEGAALSPSAAFALALGDCSSGT